VVKICGVTSSEDCRRAIDAGASHVGMILWPKSKRSVDIARAKEIVEECKKEEASSGKKKRALESRKRGFHDGREIFWCMLGQIR